MIDEKAKPIRSLSVWTYWLSVLAALVGAILGVNLLFGFFVLLGFTGLAGFLWTESYAFEYSDRSRIWVAFAKFNFWMLAVALPLAFLTLLLMALEK